MREELIHMTAPKSPIHPPMSREDRAAQFAPFAALTGHEEAIREASRVTEKKKELAEDEREKLDEAWAFLKCHEKVSVKIRYFEPDLRKEGGAYLEKEGRVKKVLEMPGILTFEDGTEILSENILEIMLDK